MARFGHPLKPSKPSQQRSKALERQNPPQQVSKASGVPPALLWYLPKPHKLFLLGFYWAKLLRGTFWAPLKTLKTFAAAFEGLRTSKPSAAGFEGVPPALPWYPPRPHKLFHWASKLLRGTFWAPLKTLKTFAAFEGLRTFAAAFEGVPPALLWYLPKPHPQAVSLKPSKPSQQLSKALERQNPPQQLSKASRLLCHGT